METGFRGVIQSACVKWGNGKFMPAAPLLTRDEVTAYIHDRVWEGQLCFEHIRACTLSLCQEIETWVEMEISQQILKKRESEQSWPVETDCDRLCKAFQDLEALQIIALHAPDTRITGCLGAARDAWVDDGAEDSPKIGYVTYSTECIQQAIRIGQLQLSYGNIPIHPAARKQVIEPEDIAFIAIDILRDHGFTAKRTGLLLQNLVIDPFKWQKRSPTVRN
jgi:hypothetical protein